MRRPANKRAGTIRIRTLPTPPAPPKPGMMQEVFNLDEGPVTLTFPAALSSESYADLVDQLELFLRRAKRRAGKSDEAAN